MWVEIASRLLSVGGGEGSRRGLGQDRGSKRGLDRMWWVGGNWSARRWSGIRLVWKRWRSCMRCGWARQQVEVEGVLASLDGADLRGNFEEPVCHTRRPVRL